MHPEMEVTWGTAERGPEKVERGRRWGLAKVKRGRR